MRIYLSSTAVDLLEHRQAVARVLRQMGHEVVGMEEYVAEGARPLERCLADVAGADLYVGIFAWQYGFVPDATRCSTGLLPPNTTPGLTSITEFELRKAEDMGKKPLVFLLDPKASWPVPYIDALTGEGEQGARILRLRNELGTSALVGFFTTPEDLARQVAAAVHRGEVRDRMQRLSLHLETGFADALVQVGWTDESTLLAMQQSLVTADSLAALRIDLRDGAYWWLSRLHLLAALAEDVTRSRLLLIVEHGNTYLGATTPATLRERLLRTFPALQRVDSALRRLPFEARHLAAALDRRFQTWRRVLPEPEEAKLRTFVTVRDLRRWLGDDLITRAVDRGADELTPAFLKAVLDWPHPLIPVVAEGRLEMVVDRAALGDQLARMFVADLAGDPRRLAY